MSNNSNYNADSIRILSDLDHIRQRSGMYIGDNGVAHLLQEIIDNAIDEIECHGSDKIEVHINKSVNDDMTYTVVDAGSGIPVGYKEVNGKKVSILEAILTKTNSGGKFDNTAYLSSAGTNGVGSTVVNALADEVIVTSIYDGIEGTIHCVNGTPVEQVKYEKTPNKKSGTTFSFTIKKNNPYFEDNQVSFDYIVNKLNVYQAFGIKGIRLFLNNEDVTDEYIVATSPFDLHKHPMDSGENAIIVDVAVEAKNKERFRFAFNYISSSSTSYKFNGYTNLLYNKDGGGHILAAQDALVEAFDRFCEKRNIQKPSNMQSDYFIGLNAIISCNIIEKAFASQTKDRLITGTGTTRNYFNDLKALLVDAILEQFDKHVGVVKAIVQRISDYRKERENRKELKGLSQYITINQSTDNTVRRGSVYEKLTECSSKNRDECEVIMTEGDSASGGLIRTRDKKTVAVLPLRGKIKNVVGCSITDVLKNKEIAGIISTMGCGILDKCNADRLRYNDVMYAADADADGAHITNLVIALFVNLMPDIVKAGKLKLIISPLYGYKNKNNEWQPAFTFDELPKDIQKSGNFVRYKGLGSLDDIQVKEFLLNKNKRKTVTVEYPSDIDEFNNVLGTAEGRRKLLVGLGILQE